MSIFSDKLRQSLRAAGIEYEEEGIALCEQYFRLVAGANKHMNLTRITDEEEAAQRHFAEAALLLTCAEVNPGCRVIDIGTGAGFPGIPIKLLRPGTDLTLLDSSGKKTDFIHSAAAEIGIDVNVITARAEEAAQGSYRESFDIAISRAVAPLNMLAELCAPFVRVGGTFAAWKGEGYKDELSQAQGAFSILECTLKKICPVGEGAVILIEKTKSTPSKYPRRYAKIKASPL